MKFVHVPLIELLLTLASPAIATDEAVKRLEQLAQSFPTTVEKSPAAISPPSSMSPDWFRRKVYVTDIAFDVRRTDSLVSPLAGEITFNCSARGTKAASREAVIAAPDSFDLLAGRCKSVYAYQSSRWVLKSTSCSDALNKAKPWRLIEAPDQGVQYNCAALLPQE